MSEALRARRNTQSALTEDSEDSMVYLVQHGEAKSKEEDPDRPLTDQGRDEVRQVADLARRTGIEVDVIVHSGKLRAQQTAEHLARAFSPKPRIEEQSFLKATEDPAAAVRSIENGDESVMFVGHLPHLSRLVGYLTVGDPDQDVVSFRYGAIVAIDRDDSSWKLKWILTPEMAAASS